MSKKNKSTKKLGLIRWNAIIPFCVFILILITYFHFFFDSHIKSMIEWAGFKALGSEINISKFDSSFSKGRVEISKIEITDSTQPELNSIEISSVRFDLNWDALLRMKFVIEEMAAEGLQFGSRRSSPGRVAPPSESSANEPSFTDQLQGRAIDKFNKENSNNILGDVASFLKSGDIQSQLKNFENTLTSKKMAEDLKIKWTGKQAEWSDKIKSLPNEKDLSGFKTRFETIKYKDFKSPDELKTSIDQFNSLKSDVDSKVKIVDSAKNNLSDDLKSVQTDYQNLEKQIKIDIDQIKTRFKIPKLDAGQFAKSLFMQYLTPYTQKLDRYKALAQKYLPPKYARMLDSKKSDDAKDDDSIQQHPRDHGVTYEFPILKGYPLFWIQTVKISSRSNAQVDYGDMSGTIKNITSNQRQIGKATTLNVNGDFKSKNVSGIKVNASFNNMKVAPEVEFAIDVANYPLEKLQLLSSNDGAISIPKANNSLAIEGKTMGFKDYNIKLLNNFKNVNFDASAKDSTVSDILKQTFSTITDFDLQASAKGELKDLNIEISSSLGDNLQKAFSSLLQKKIDEVNAQIKAKIDEEIGKVRKDIDQQVNALKNKFTNEITQAQSQLDGQKKQAEDRITVAKKDLENQAKNKLQNEAQKAAEELKKKLGF